MTGKSKCSSKSLKKIFLWFFVQIDIFMDLAGGHINFGTKVGLETSLLLISQPFAGLRQNSIFVSKDFQSLYF